MSALRSLLATALLLPACAAVAPPPPPEEAPPAAAAPGSPVAPGFPAPDRLEEGDRWFVAVRADGGREPLAERHRRRRFGDLVREEVVWDRTFAGLAAAEHGTAQVFALTLDGKGLGVSLLDADGRPLGEPALELAAPYRVGTSWTVEGAGGSIACRIEALEETDTPAGKAKALRVSHRGGDAEGMTMLTWYDAGLRPVRSEVRRGGARGALVEARAALASPEPSPEECRAAVEWARKNLGR